MKLSHLVLFTGLAGLVACSGSTAPESPAPTEQKAEGKAKKAKKAPAGEEGEAAAEGAEKEEGPQNPVLRTGRFRIPLKALGEADLPAVTAAIAAAWEKAGKDEATEAIPPDTKSKPWKCRHATVWDVAAPTGAAGATAPQVRLFERLDNTDCKAEGAKEERWEVSLRGTSTARPTSKEEGGKLKYLMSSEDLDWNGTAFADTFSTIYRTDGGDTDGGFPHDEAWLKEQLPGAVSLTGKHADLDSWRWLIATVTIGGEKVAIEAERWNCTGTDKVVGAELVFRTNKRAPGHTTTNPKDVVVTDRIKGFAAELVKGLGDKVGGDGAVSAAGLTCATP